MSERIWKCGCKKCGAKFSFRSSLGTQTLAFWNKALQIHNCGKFDAQSASDFISCGTIIYKKKAKPSKCGPRCMGATGHDCDCECGGKNHGANHLSA